MQVKPAQPSAKDEDLEWFLEQFGAPTCRSDVDRATIERFRGKLPDQLLTYWETLGFCSFRDGLFTLTNPDEFESDLEAWIGDTDIVEKDAYRVIARTGFGKLFLWGTKTGYMVDIDPVRGWIYCEDRHTADIAVGHADRCLRWFLSGTDPESLDIQDGGGKPLFTRAVAKLGPLGPAEVFAFEPALAMGGTPKVDNIAKRDVHVQAGFLAQLGHREVLDRQSLARKVFG